MLARVVLRAALVTAVIAAGGPRMSEAQLSQTAFGQSSVFVVSPLNVAPDATVTVQQPGEKSPGLAGILSFFLPFGTGSFYAGNNGHGIRHLVIGGATVVGLGVSVASSLYAADPEPPAAQILIWCVRPRVPGQLGVGHDHGGE